MKLRNAAAIAAVAGCAAAWSVPAHASDQSRRIGYVTTDLHWSLYQTAERTECPDGLNDNGPREIFEQLYPRGGTEVDTRLRREALKFFPADADDKYSIPLAAGPIAIGLNLDGKIGDRDFVSPSGEQGIDNELYRLIGCVRSYRKPDGQIQLFSNRGVRGSAYNRMMIELTEVDSLVDDEEVVVTTYRGIDRLLNAATDGHIQPGGTQRVDQRFGARYVNQLKGKIVDGVLTTEPQTMIWPWSTSPGERGEYLMRDMRLRLKLSDTAAEGLIAGYNDIEYFYRTLTHLTTHHLSYGQLDPSVFYRELSKLADAYPNDDGKMTAISFAIDIKMVHVFVEHDPAQ